MLKLMIYYWLLCLLLQVFAPNTVSEYTAFVDNVNDNLQRVSSTEPPNILEDFNAKIETDNKA